MRFQTTVRPVLTPLGQRLINISERKLYSLDSPLNNRDEATLLKGVLVREAVRSAWRSVANGQQVQVNNWQETNVMGLDSIGEEEEDEEESEQENEVQDYHNSVVEQRNERWFEELVQSFGEDDVEQHEWIESEVGAPVDYDDFGLEDFEHYTLPSPPTSPIQLPSSPVSSPSALVSDVSPTTSTIELDAQPEDESASSAATVYFDVVEVQDYGERPDYHEVTSAPLSNNTLPSTPILFAHDSPSSSPIPVVSLTDDELECDDISLPPPLHRCSSSSSLPCECEDLESNGSCATPTSSCDSLDWSVDSLLAGESVLADPGDKIRLAFDHDTFATSFEKWQRGQLDKEPLPSPSGALGLGLEISLEALSSD